MEQTKKNFLLKIASAKDCICIEEKQIQKALLCLQEKCVTFNFPAPDNAKNIKEDLQIKLDNFTALEWKIQEAKNTLALEIAIAEVEQFLDVLNINRARINTTASTCTVS